MSMNIGATSHAVRLATEKEVQDLLRARDEE